MIDDFFSFKMQRVEGYEWGFDMFCFSIFLTKLFTAIAKNVDGHAYFCCCDLDRIDGSDFWTALGPMVYCEYLKVNFDT